MYSQNPELPENTDICLDDIFIHAKHENTYKTVLERVCKCLDKFNFGINLSICVLGKPSLNYMDFKITSNSYCTLDEKVKAICDYLLPKTMGQLMRCCGNGNFFYRNSIA